MRKDWLNLCRQMVCTEGDYWNGGKKILRNRQAYFPDPLGPMTIEEIGFTRTKMNLLTKGYLHEESLSSAVDQWNNRRNYKARAHWSVGFSCYNHILKSHSRLDDEDSMGSIMGPCLQAVTITHTCDGVAEVDVFYRTTELFKKFPADLVLIRDHMLSRFDWERTPLGGMRMHFTNMTVSPTYFPIVLMKYPDPVGLLKEVESSDPAFHKTALRWLGKLMTGPTPKFNQARRTQLAVKSLMSDDKAEALIAYGRQHSKEHFIV